MENNVNVLPKGTELHNGKRKYKVEQVLGTGGFGITYKVSSTVMVDNVAINTFFAMKEYFLSSCYRDKDNATMLFSPTMKIEVEQSLNDFITEAKRLNSLGHKSDNIVKVNEVFKENGTAYYIMEYLEGGNLQEYVRKKGPLNEAEAIALITPIAHAVDTLHSERILHLDIKPENIVLKKDRDTGMITPVLIDFGLVKHFDSKGKPTTRLAAKGASDGFAPMEQYTTIDNFAPTLDVYALGATLYYLLKGKNPPKAFDIESSAALKDTLPASVTEKTKDAIAHAMEKSRFERTQLITEFLISLTDQIIETKLKTNVTTRFKDQDKRKKHSFIGWILGGILLILFAIVYLVFYCDKESITYESASNYYKSGEYDKAITIIRKVLAKEESADAAYLYGQLLDMGYGKNELDSVPSIFVYEKSYELGNYAAACKIESLMVADNYEWDLWDGDEWSERCKEYQSRLLKKVGKTNHEKDNEHPVDSTEEGSEDKKQKDINQIIRGKAVDRNEKVHNDMKTTRVRG